MASRRRRAAAQGQDEHAPDWQMSRMKAGASGAFAPIEVSHESARTVLEPLSYLQSWASTRIGDRIDTLFRVCSSSWISVDGVVPLAQMIARSVAPRSDSDGIGEGRPSPAAAPVQGERFATDRCRDEESHHWYCRRPAPHRPVVAATGGVPGRARLLLVPWGPMRVLRKSGEVLRRNPEPQLPVLSRPECRQSS